MTIPNTDTISDEDIETPTGAGDPAADAPVNEPADDGDPGEPSWEDLAAERDQLRADLDAAGAGKLAAEAAKYRTKLREAERQLADATALVDRLHEQAARGELDRAGLDYRLLEFAKRNVEEFVTEDGLLDAKALIAALEPVAAELGMSKARKPQPNPVAGRTGGSTPTVSGKAAWDAAFGVQQAS